MYLFFDTETTGLKPYQDHIVQLAWILADEYREVVGRGNLIVAPDGYTIPPGAARIHGITTAKARACGEALDDVLHDFNRDAVDAHILVAHNLDFDLAILRTAYRRAMYQSPLEGKVAICTMKSSTQWCRLPFSSGRSGYKWPKLEELHAKLFGYPFANAHDASADVEACMRCYFALLDRGILEPAAPAQAAKHRAQSTVTQGPAVGHAKCPHCDRTMKLPLPLPSQYGRCGGCGGRFRAVMGLYGNPVVYAMR